jgi:MoaA/NifB/PqqE/SkfB family radical SAM enzyme
MNVNVAWDVLKKALHSRKHPGISEQQSLVSLMRQGLPYLTSGRPRPPRTIYWNVNSVCNLHCKMCDVGTANEDANFFKNLRIDRKLHEITVERFKSVTDEVAQYHPMMSINGTEPIMYKPLGEVIAYARHAGLAVAVTTGAYTLPKRAEELAEAGLTRLNVSIDGPPQVHNYIRGRSDSFEKATEGIVKFKGAARQRSYEPEVLVNFTITNMNFDHLEKFYDSISAYPVDRLNFVLMNFVNEEMAQAHNLEWGKKYFATVNCLNEDTQPGKVNVSVLAQQMEAVRRKGGSKVTFLPFYNEAELTKFLNRPMEFMGHVPCVSSWFIAQILADGEVIPYTRCYHVPFGNINVQPFMEIWNGEKADAWRRDLRKHGRFPACTRCDMVY